MRGRIRRKARGSFDVDQPSARARGTSPRSPGARVARSVRARLCARSYRPADGDPRPRSPQRRPLMARLPTRSRPTSTRFAASAPICAASSLRACSSACVPFVHKRGWHSRDCRSARAGTQHALRTRGSRVSLQNCLDSWEIADRVLSAAAASLQASARTYYCALVFWVRRDDRWRFSRLLGGIRDALFTKPVRDEFGSVWQTSPRGRPAPGLTFASCTASIVS